MHVLDAVRWLISLQTAFCIAPYRIRDRRLVCSAATTGWTVVGALLFVAVVAYSAVRAYAEHSMELRFRNGYLWGIIATFEFSFTNFAYPALVVHSLRHRRDPIAFYNGIADMDAQLRRELGVRTGPLNRRLHRIIMWFIGLSFPFFNCLWAALLLLFALNGLQLGMGVLLFVCANQLEQLTMGLLTWSLVSHLLVMRARFRALRTVRLNGGGAGGRLSAGASTVARTRRRVAVWLSAFQRLVGMLDRLSVGVGNVVALRFTHDFTLLLSQVYLVYWLVADYRRQHLATIVFVAFWSVPNVLKIGATTYAAHVTVEEAYRTSAAICAQNVDGIDVVVKQMLDSFALWLLHRKIRFTANNFFTVDLTLVYAVVGALASYLLILIQFKQQEESLSAATAAATTATAMEAAMEATMAPLQAV